MPTYMALPTRLSFDVTRYIAIVGMSEFGVVDILNGPCTTTTMTSSPIFACCVFEAFAIQTEIWTDRSSLAQAGSDF